MFINLSLYVGYVRRLNQLFGMPKTLKSLISYKNYGLAQFSNSRAISTKIIIRDNGVEPLPQAHGASASLMTLTY